VRIISRWERTAQRVVENSNTTFIQDAGSTSFVTLFYAILDEKSRTLTYVNAGHNPPLLCRADGTMEELGPTGPVIGLIDTPVYDERSVILTSGDMLVMYTDGVTEAMNEKEEMFSDARLMDVVRAGHTLPAPAMVERIRTAVVSFCGSAPQSDDITIMVLTAK
jgi:sigma-B regulation protein RsbU (phosphoserine phosphatase)